MTSAKRKWKELKQPKKKVHFNYHISSSSSSYSPTMDDFEREIADTHNIISSVPFVGKTGIKYFDSQKAWKFYGAKSEKVYDNDEFGITWNTDFTCSCCASIIDDRLLFFCYICSSTTRQFFCENCVEICPEDECTLICNTCQPDGFRLCDTEGCEASVSCQFQLNVFSCSTCPIEEKNMFCGQCTFDCICGGPQKVCLKCSEENQGQCKTCECILCSGCGINCGFNETCGFRYCDQICLKEDENHNCCICKTCGFSLKQDDIKNEFIHSTCNLKFCSKDCLDDHYSFCSKIPIKKPKIANINDESEENEEDEGDLSEEEEGDSSSEES